MKLRTKFVFLIIGIVVVPFLVAYFLGNFYMTYVKNERLTGFFPVHKWVDEQLSPAIRSGNWHMAFSKIPPEVKLLFLDETGVIRYSSFQELVAGERVHLSEAVSIIIDSYENSLLPLNVEPVQYKSKPSGAIIWVRTPAPIELDTLPPTPPDELQFKLTWFMFVAILLIGAIAGSLVINTFRRSILKLEEATKHISGNDLSFALEAKGTDEIASLTRAFDAMRVKLKEETEKRSRFLMAVSHDLSTPLTSIKGYIEAIEDGLAATPEDLKKYLAIMMEKSRVLEERIAKLIEFVRMGTGEWKSTYERVALKDFLISVSKTFKEDAVTFKRRFLSSILIPDTITVLLDKHLLSRALENLLTNSFRYTKEGDSIHLKASCNIGVILLTFEDTGSGIPQEDIDHIFDPFYRSKHFSKEHGFGLGLFIVKSILDAHGWNISVSSQQGGGPVFTISIPLE